MNAKEADFRFRESYGQSADIVGINIDPKTFIPETLKDKLEDLCRLINNPIDRNK